MTRRGTKQYAVKYRKGYYRLFLEPEFWDALNEICKREKITKKALVERAADHIGTRYISKAIKVFIVHYFIILKHKKASCHNSS